MSAAAMLRGAARWGAGSGQIRHQARRLPQASEVGPEQHYRAQSQGPADLAVSYDGGEYQPAAERELEAG